VSAAYEGTERRALDRSQRAYAASYTGTDGNPIFGAFTLTDTPSGRVSAWVVTGSLSEARMIAWLHNYAYGFGD
jgi:hypothetical protein